MNDRKLKKNPVYSLPIAAPNLGSLRALPALMKYWIKVKRVMTVYASSYHSIDRLSLVYRYVKLGDCSLVRRFCSPKVRKSEIKGSSFRRFCSPKVLQSDNDFYSFLF